MSKKATVRQIILVTDGESNMGGDPVLKAKKAYGRNILVNTVGILSQNQQEEKPFQEVANIAKAGGGKYEYSYLEGLAQTIQSVSYQTVSSTLQEAVNSQLKEIMGADLSQLHPTARGKLLNYIEEYAEEVNLYCCILLDCSGSMNSKIQTARHSILDLMESFCMRKGETHIAVIGYPGEGMNPCTILQDFADPIQELERNLYKIKPKGGTPTAQAIEHGIRLIEAYEKFGLDRELEAMMVQEG